jgi:APA family basic amino acid/polyamine antiporter
MENRLCTVGAFARIQTALIAVGVALPNLPRTCMRFVIRIFYTRWDFKLNAAQIVSIFTIILLSYINSRGVKL